MPLLLLLAAIIAAWAPAVAAQQPDTGSLPHGTLTGMVLDAATGAPLPGATVVTVNH